VNPENHLSAQDNPPDPVAYIISENLMRRHLTVGQRAMLAEKLALLPPYRPNGKFADPQTYSQEKVSEAVGIRPQAIRQARAAKRLGTTSKATVAEISFRFRILISSDLRGGFEPADISRLASQWIIRPP
jgi:hypothetical protein